MLPPEFWQAERERLLAELLPHLTRLSLEGAAAGADKLRQAGLSFDNSLVHARAATWARERAGELVDQLGETSETGINEIVANWIETPGATMGDLVEQLSPVLEGNAVRADMVGVTEVTSAFAQGEALVYEEAGISRPVFLPPGHPRCRCWTGIREVNGVWVVVWLTNRDEITCRNPIETPWGIVRGCRELHRVVLSEGDLLGRRV